MDALNLAPGVTFSLSDTQAALNFAAIAEVQNIPTIVDGGASGSIEGGMLVDYESYIITYMAASGTSDPAVLPVSINYVWLKTDTDAATLAHVRHALTTEPMQLNPLNDHAALLNSLQQSTTQRNLIGILSFVAVVPLLLALVGSLLASWISVQNRLTSFAVLRALGCTPRQLASTLSLELVIVYASALVLGAALGLSLAFQTVPHLVYTDTSSTTGSTQIFLAQHVPPVSTVIPVSLMLILGLLVLLCLGILTLMVYTVSHPATSQMLRLNED